MPDAARGLKLKRRCNAIFQAHYKFCAHILQLAINFIWLFLVLLT